MEMGPIGSQEGSEANSRHPPTVRIPRTPFGCGQNEGSVKAQLKRHAGGRGRHEKLEEGEDDEDEIGIHMWENRGNLVMESAMV